MIIIANNNNNNNLYTAGELTSQRVVFSEAL